MNGLAVTIPAVAQEETIVSLGTFIRSLLSLRGVDQVEVARLAQLRPAQMSKIVNGGSVLSEQYELIARALRYRNALEMFRAPEDPLLRQLMRLWPALPDATKRDLVKRAKESFAE